MADRVENQEDFKKARLEEKNNRRKQKINHLIMQKRKVDTHQDELNEQLKECSDSGRNRSGKKRSREKKDHAPHQTPQQ